MQRRIEIDCALSSMMPKAVPDAPLGARARQWYPNKHRYEKTTHDCPPCFMNKIVNYHLSKSRALAPRDGTTAEARARWLTTTVCTTASLMGRA
jgi:hypothetical protein